MDNMSDHLFDCIVVGSGPAGVMCAQTLVEAGKQVLLMDGGFNSQEEDKQHGKSFTEIRKTDNEQRNVFLGKELNVIDIEPGKAYSHMTPQRKFVIDGVNEYMPMESQDYAGMESLAIGGLGAAWGLGCFKFSDAELIKAGLDTSKMKAAYQIVADRIGISYSSDDIQKFTANDLQRLQPSINLDDNGKELLKRYTAKRSVINKDKLYAGIPPLALLTNNKDGRDATDYSNMDFYYNYGNSAYRPSVTLNLLKSKPSFFHLPRVLITSFEENENEVLVHGLKIASKNKISFKCRKLALASNVLSSARIALRSFNLYNKRLPFLCNPYSMLATLQYRQIGKAPSTKRTSTAQVCIFYDKDDNAGDMPMASLYPYSSLMLFRLIKESPLNYKASMKILKHLHPAIVVAGIHHPTERTKEKYIFIYEDNSTLTGDKLKVVYTLNQDEKSIMRKNEHKFAKVLRQLGCLPFKKTIAPSGASVHYAGTIPFNDSDSPLSLSAAGLLSGTKNVYVSDASGFRYLPAKGATFTIMANAHNTALNIIKHA
ncbi:MAG TPA: NAD(P)/FAD-dependent oxidoreductase [Flavitalea sp.]|nr:NAD(P)/FAD-dependent oxidoreductase [Flavitalea sp.]